MAAALGLMAGRERGGRMTGRDRIRVELEESDYAAVAAFHYWRRRSIKVSETRASSHFISSYRT